MSIGSPAHRSHRGRPGRRLPADGLAAGARTGPRRFRAQLSAGVEIEVEGARAGDFVDALRSAPPPLARIASLAAREVPPRGDDEFLILPSREAGAATEISPDIATCPDCLRELADPADRRFSYPFINCTNCGPRYSITLRVPYDRPNTTMAAFTLCPECAREYRDPGDRRFHAQPNACPACGPGVSFRRGAPAAPGAPDPTAVADPAALHGREALTTAIDLLRRGGILALKGLGGYQLACDALDAAAVGRLRERKRRSNKAFALMAPEVAAVRAFAVVSDEEEALLRAPERPIVLLARRPAAHSRPRSRRPRPNWASCCEHAAALAVVPRTPHPALSPLRARGNR